MNVQYLMLLPIHLQQNITTKLAKRVSERDMTITPHHLEANDVRKVQGFLNTYGN